jgi:type I restriction enzyme M protein
MKLEHGHIDTVIGLPANQFYSTGIPVYILVLKKCRKSNDVLFINAAADFVKGKWQNRREGEAQLRMYHWRQKHPAAPRDPGGAGSLVARSVWKLKR